MVIKVMFRDIRTAGRAWAALLWLAVGMGLIVSMMVLISTGIAAVLGTAPEIGMLVLLGIVIVFLWVRSAWERT